MNGHMTSPPGPREKALAFYPVESAFGKSGWEDDAPTRSHSRQSAEGQSIGERFHLSDTQMLFGAERHHRLLAQSTLPASASNMNGVLSFVAVASPASSAPFEAFVPVQDQTLLLYKSEKAAEYTRKRARSNFDGHSTTPPFSELAKLIVSERSRAEIDADCVEIGDVAKDDAVDVVQHANLGGKPRVMFSNDGILTLQWQRGEHGVALIFAGDGVVSIAFRRPGQFYAENGIDAAISDDLPAQFFNALANAI